MRQKTGVGIIGTGLRGMQVIAPRIVELQDSISLEIRGLCDRLPDRLAEALDQLKTLYTDKGPCPEIKTYSDYQDLIDDPEIDLIIITTPTHCHKANAIAALESGKHVYLDKPIEVTLEAARKILEAEKRTQNRLIMGFTRRYEASWLKAFEILQSGEIGNLKMMQIRSVIPYTRYYHLWHRRNKYSGGALNDKSSHHMDVFNWFAGSRPLKLNAFGGYSGLFPEKTDTPAFCSECDLECDFNFFKDYQLKELKMSSLPPSYFSGTEEQSRLDNCVYKSGADILDHISAQILYDNGVTASLMLCIFGPEAQDQETLELIGDQGRLVLTRSKGEIIVYSRSGAPAHLIDARNEEFASSHFGADLELVRELDRFCHGARPRAKAQDGYDSLQMIHGIYHSVLKKGESISIDQIRDINLDALRTLEGKVA